MKFNRKDFSTQQTPPKGKKPVPYYAKRVFTLGEILGRDKAGKEHCVCEYHAPSFYKGGANAFFHLGRFSLEAKGDRFIAALIEGMNRTALSGPVQIEDGKLSNAFFSITHDRLPEANYVFVNKPGWQPESPQDVWTVFLNGKKGTPFLSLHLYEYFNKEGTPFMKALIESSLAFAIQQRTAQQRGFPRGLPRFLRNCAAHL